MLRLALTGGIGAGKSTVSAALVTCGAHLIDMDVLAREVVEPGTSGLAEIRKEFGEEYVSSNGGLDRVLLGARVFSDAGARATLNSILHPLIGAESDRCEDRIASSNPDAVVVFDIPLLYESVAAASYHGVIVVETEIERRISRLVERGLSRESARDRIAAQVSDEQRREIADVVLVNDGTRDELHSNVGELWSKRLSLYRENLAKAIPAWRESLPPLVVGHTEWGRQFKIVRDRVLYALTGLDVRVDHIGSTAVPGLPARDIIDLQVEVQEPADLPEVSARLRKIGLVNGMAELPSDQDVSHGPLFNTDPGRAVDCYVRASGKTTESARYITSWLKSHTSDRDEYRKLKERFAHTGRQQYLEAATQWQCSLLERIESQRR